MGWIDDWRKKYASGENRPIAEMPIEARRALVEGMANDAVENGRTESLWALVDSAERAGEDSIAEKWLKKLAGLNDPDAPLRLGLLYNGRGDVRQAIEWYLKSAAIGDSEAMFNLGNQYLNSGDRGEAMRWYTKAAEAGDVDAMRKITGEYLQNGKPEDALRWASKAVQAGSEDALAMHGVLALALAGDADSAANLGDVMRSTENQEQAAYWYRKAADAGNANAALALGGIIGSDALLDWLGEAIKAGNPAANELLRQVREGN
jgi:TPR repeat protein